MSRSQKLFILYYWKDHGFKKHQARYHHRKTLSAARGLDLKMYIENETNNPSFKLSNIRFSVVIPKHRSAGLLLRPWEPSACAKACVNHRRDLRIARGSVLSIQLVYTLWLELSCYPTAWGLGGRKQESGWECTCPEIDAAPRCPVSGCF